MADDILQKIKSGEKISSDDVKKSTDGLKALNEGYVEKHFIIETSSDHSKDNQKDNK